MEKCYRVEFCADLQRVTLALKMKCFLEVIWKRGDKIAQSGRVELENGAAQFGTKLTISCNMIYDTKTKLFRQKNTKFQILLHSQKGSKQAGEVEFNVAEYVNQNQLHKKNYEIYLQKCPDKHSKISFTISGCLKQEISQDNISQQSYATTRGQNLMLDSKISITDEKQKKTPPLPPIKQITRNSEKNMSEHLQQSSSFEEKVHNLQEQNKKIREELKKIEVLRQENKQLSHRIQNEDYSSTSQMKKKMDNYRKQIQKIKADIRNSKDIEAQTKTVQGQILKCKVKIMKAFNHAMEFGGSQLTNAIQQFCGLRQQ